MSSLGDPHVQVHLTAGERSAALRRDVAAGLTASPKVLPPTWFYDERGGKLFDEITRLPEYYPTRAEYEILTAHATEIVSVTGADTLVDLGSGTSEKTQVLLEAMAASGTLRRFIPFDVDEAGLREAVASFAHRFPGTRVEGVVGDLHNHLDRLPTEGRRLLALLGGTIGNLRPEHRASFLTGLRGTMEVDDALLLGTDLVKDPGRLIAAYDDTAGVTASFNRNVLSVVNSQLGGDFDPEAFDHVALWNEAEAWIEMRLRSRQNQRVRIEDLDLEVTFSEGEDLLTEVSAKFTEAGVRAELTSTGLRPERAWTDQAGQYLLTLAKPVA